MFKYSYNSLVYYGEKVKESVERVARSGYDAIELYGEPDEYDTAEVRKLCEVHNINEGASGINLTIEAWKRYETYCSCWLKKSFGTESKISTVVLKDIFVIQKSRNT